MEQFQIFPNWMLRVLFVTGIILSMQTTAEAQCPPGYIQVGLDCSARDAHNRSCDTSYYEALAAASAAYGVCKAACDDDDDCRDDCRDGYGAAVAAASAKLAVCRARAPACVSICEIDPTHPRWWCPLWPGCGLASGSREQQHDGQDQSLSVDEVAIYHKQSLGGQSKVYAPEPEFLTSVTQKMLLRNSLAADLPLHTRGKNV